MKDSHIAKPVKELLVLIAPFIDVSMFPVKYLAFHKVQSRICILTVSIHCAPEMSEIDCIGRIESFWPKFVRGW